MLKRLPAENRNIKKKLKKEMRLFSPPTTSSSSTRASFTPFSSCQNPNNNNGASKFYLKIPSNTPTIPCSSKLSPPVLDWKPLSSESGRNSQIRKESTRSMEAEKDSLEGVLEVRRPMMEVSSEYSGENESERDDEMKSSVFIDASLNEFAKKMPIFEPERVKSGTTQEKPLLVNLDLALYKSKILARSYRYEEAEKMLEKCITYWPEDGRPYVALGKILNKQSKTEKARAVYEKGCQATQGENPYIWQCWAVLENKMGNIRRARELFDAATVADKRHTAAWHGWAVLELKQGNVKKGRQLLVKGLKYCGGNEYIYQTLALLEAKANRYKQARHLFRQATKCNPKSCASWLAWAQLEMQHENNFFARQLFEKAIQASPKNRFALHVWGLFEATMGDIEKARKLLKIGHALNPLDPVLLQSLALLEYKQSAPNIARSLFRRASELDPRHQPVWIAWGWMEWKEGNISSARELYRRALSIDSNSESAARCLQAWGVLEQRAGNLSAARRLFRSSLQVNSQSYITWMTWAQLEEDIGNSVRAEEIRNLYFQQRTEVVDDTSWVNGFFDIIDPALDSLKRFLTLDQNLYKEEQGSLRNLSGANDQNGIDEKSVGPTSSNYQGNAIQSGSGFDLDSFMKERLSLDPTKLDVRPKPSGSQAPLSVHSTRRIWRSHKRSSKSLSKSGI